MSKLENSATMASHNVVVIPYPSQGHVNPLMHLCQSFAKQGIKSTVVNTEFVHAKMVKAMGDKIESVLGSRIELVAVPDGFGPDESRDNIERLFVDIMNNLQFEFEKLLPRMNSEIAGGIACVIVDLSMAWILEITEKLGIRGAIFSPFTAAHSVLNISINKLIEDGIIDAEGQFFCSSLRLLLHHSLQTAASCVAPCIILKFEKKLKKCRGQTRDIFSCRA